MNTPAPVIVWFRQDLRLTDNPALAAAAGAPVIPLFILETDGGTRSLGGASRWWLHHSLAALRQSFEALGTPLILRRGRPEQILSELITEAEASAVHWNRCYEPQAIARDTAIKAALKKAGHSVVTFNSALLAEPWEIKTGQGGPYKVFTPFWRALTARDLRGSTVPAPERLDKAPTLSSEALEDWRLLPTAPDWSSGLAETWQPGEHGAWRRLQTFLESGLSGYEDQRNRPDLPGTSMLSPHLHFGEISPRSIWQQVAERRAKQPKIERHASSLLRELGWREFSHHLLYHFPTIPDAALRVEFDRFPWIDDQAALKAWQKGLTGYPIVDAGMRQLWQTGWMHNRVRMVVGSFLVKHLLADWRHGEAWFWDTLVDADLANNVASWQWIAGSGADAAPYFRIMSPMLQGEKFDPRGDYVRRYVPELARLPNPFIHAPWSAPTDILAEAGIRLGETYPKPMIDHRDARSRALAALATLRSEEPVEA